VPHAPSDALSRRHAAIRQAMATASIDALVVVAIPNITYLTNFAGSSAIVVLTPDRLQFITDGRYTTAIGDMQGTSHECPGLELVVVEGSYDATLAAVLGRSPAGRIGFEAAHLTVSRFRWLEAAMREAARPHELTPVESLIEVARSVKDAYEIALFRTAGAMLSDVTRRVLQLARAGITERDLALEIDAELRRGGFEKPAFETIVASGPQSALPHARPTNRKLGEGDLVVLDFGGVYDSYCVDLTRTVVVGPPSQRALEVHAAVRTAHDLAIEAVAPGASRFDIDAAARNALAGAGMGAAFGHGTGHGLGIDIHEDPRVTRRGPGVDTSREAVVPGMVFTIEPGAYFPGWGGVRIEDDVLVTEGGVELLTDAPTDLIVV
jgi:Xaa-Pro aminopeptidase